MTKQNDKHDKQAQPPEDDGASRDPATNESEGVGTTPDQEIDALQHEVAELKDKLLRAAADYQNVIRRSQLNIEEARDEHIGMIAKDLVTVMDHFDRALQVDQEKTSLQTVLQGLQMVHEELLKTLEKYGVKRVEAKPGEEFDPNRHAALMRQKSEGVPAGHIAAQFQPGYTLNDRPLRPAQVSIAE